MTVSPVDILDEARALLALPRSQRTEARRRTIISRAYYAAYHHLLKHPEVRGFRSARTAGKGMHTQFLDYLSGAGDRNVLHAAAILRKLRELRVAADYHLDKRLAARSETQALEDAAAMIEDILPID